MKKMIILFLITVLTSLSPLVAGPKEQWTEFLTAVEKCGLQPDATYTNDAAAFKSLLTDLNTLQALHLWRATVFYQAMKQTNIETIPAHQKLPFARQQLKYFATTNTASTRAFLQQLITYKNQIIKISAQRGNQFNSVQAAERIWIDLQNTVILPLSSQQFATTFKSSSFICKAIACDIMHTCVDAIDTTIKTVKTSSNLTTNEKNSLFKMMISDFFRLFETWIQSIMPEHALQYHHQYPLNIYLQEMARCFNVIIKNQTYSSYGYPSYTPPSSQYSFQRSANFSVNAAMLGSKTAFYRHLPSSAEDIFMLIHQNSLVTIGGIYASLFANQPLDSALSLPASVVEAMNYFEQGDGRDHLLQTFKSIPARIGIKYTADTIEIFYNLALNNHSATFQITYNQTSQQCALAVQFLGEARTRWERIALLAEISPELSGLELAQEVFLDKNAGIVNWSWVVKPSHLRMIAQHLGKMAYLSYENMFYNHTIAPLRINTAIPLNQAMQQITKNYQIKYGNNFAIQELLNIR